MRIVVAQRMFLVAWLIVGCGYNTTGRSSGSIGDVYLPFFNDLTTGERVDELGIQLTNLLLVEFLQDKDLRVYQGTNERDLADKELLGTVKRFTEAVITRDEQETGEEYRVVIVCSISYTDIETDESLWKDGNVFGDGNYFLSEGDEGFEDAVAKALEEIIDKILDKTVRAW